MRAEFFTEGVVTPMIRLPRKQASSSARRPPGYIGYGYRHDPMERVDHGIYVMWMMPDRILGSSAAAEPRSGRSAARDRADDLAGPFRPRMRILRCEACPTCATGFARCKAGAPPVIPSRCHPGRRPIGLFSVHHAPSRSDAAVPVSVCRGASGEIVSGTITRLRHLGEHTAVLGGNAGTIEARIASAMRTGTA